MRFYITAQIDKETLENFSKLGFVQYEGWDTTKNVFSEKELVKKIKDYNADVLIVEFENVNNEVIENTDLKLIGVCRSDPKRNVDVDAANKKKIPVIYTPGRNLNSVAELTVGIILSTIRKIVFSDRIYRKGVKIESFKDYAEVYLKLYGNEIKGKTVGIIGLGKIGRRVAKILSAFGAKIIAYDPYVEASVFKKLKVKKVSFNDLLRLSDIITVHASLTDETAGMIDEKAFSMMKDGAYFFNLASSGIVDEDALYNALKSGKLAGAGLDVVYDEPLESSNRFFELDNVVITPHIGSNTYEKIKVQSEMIYKDVLRFIQGKRPLHLLNPEVFRKIER